MAYSVVFTPEARAQQLPARSVRRDDIRPGLHLTNYRGRVVIAFAVEGSEVWIIACFTPAKTTKRFYNLTLDQPKRN
jgi:toxin ParE1/3/4